MSPETNYAQLASKLAGSLHLAQSPVAVCFSDSIPEGVGGHDGNVAAGCRFWQDAATASFATSASDHSLCAIGVYTHNLQSSPAQQIDLMDALKVFGDLTYVRQEDIAAIPVLKSQPKYIIYSPLAATRNRPDVVVLFVDANQSLIVSEATQQIENQSAPAMGRPACAAIPQVFNTGRAAMSLGCCGARAYLDVLTDDIAIFAIPGAKLAAYAERIEALSKANTVLSKFHQIRRHEVEIGKTPTIKESLVALSASS
jgi:uncharacterized protein (DUF169 family)